MFQATGLILNATTPSPFIDRREVVALLRGPAANPTQYLATQDWLRLGQWHRGSTIARIPEPQDARANDFGSQESGSTVIEVPSTGMALVAPALRFDWVSSETFADRVRNFSPTFVRANATATRVNRLGLIEGPLAADTPRFDHDLVTRERKGVLFEQSETQLLLDTSNFGGSSWGRVDSTYNASTGVLQGITGGLGARVLSSPQNVTPGAAQVRYSVLAKAGNVATATLLVWDNTAGAIRANTNFVLPAETNWISLDVTGLTPGNVHYFYVYVKDTSGGAAGDFIYLYAADVKAGAFRTSYVPTNGASATRGADALTINDLSWFNRRGGVVVVEFWAGEDAAAGVWLIDDTTANNLIELYISAGTFNFRTIAGGVTSCLLTASGALASARHRVAIAWDENNFRMSVNGGAVQADFAGAVPAVTLCRIGTSFGGGLLNGHIARWAYYPPGRSDADLISMSTPGVNAWDFGPAQLLKNQPVDIDLITRRTRLDGSQVDFINERRGTVKAVTRTPSALKLTIVDIDREAMKTLLPIETYTVANFPKLYTDHVNRPVIDCVGTNEKLSCTYIDNTPGAFKYAVCRQRTGQALPTVLTVYRGKSAGKGQIVPAAEYVVGSMLVAGVTYVTLTFTREQSDGNQLYEIEADVLGAGSRNAIDEIAYVLNLIGIQIDSADFTDAAAYHATIGTMIDACYRQQISAQSILDNLTRIARGWLAQSVTGLYSIFIDRPRTASLMLWDDSDQVQVDELSDPEIPKTITVRYRPRPGSRSEYSGDLNRTTSGASGEEIVTLEYVRDHAVADRYNDYLTKRRARARTRATVYGRVLQPGELVAINSPLVFDGWKQVAATSINRRADACEITGEIYNEADYTYTPGTLPADATNAYTPDYTFTPPSAPTAPTATGAAVTVDATGKAFANVLIRAVPPANNNWTRLWVVAKNNVTVAQTAPAELTLNAGNYEVRVGNLEPSVSYSFLIYATNIADLPGAPATVTQTMPTYSASPPTPSVPTGVQLPGLAIELSVNAPTYAHHDRVEWQRKTNVGGTYATLTGENSSRLMDSSGLAYGNTYYYKARFIDKSGNAGSYCTEQFIAVNKSIDDNHITTGGVGTNSLANLGVTSGKAGNSSIKQGKLDSSTVSGSVSMANTDILDLCQSTGGYSLCPYVSEGVDIRGHYSALSSDGLLSAYNDTGGTLTVSYSWIKVLV